MAPVTRQSHRRQSTTATDQPSAVNSPEPSTARPTRSHVRLDQAEEAQVPVKSQFEVLITKKVQPNKEEEEKEEEGVEEGEEEEEEKEEEEREEEREEEGKEEVIETNEVAINGKPEIDEPEQNEDENQESESDDDEAPETVSMGAGRENARKHEKDTKRAKEAQLSATREKRKARDALLKSQKANAQERKRRKLDDAKETSPPTDIEPKPAAPLVTKKSHLLPASLLAAVSSRTSPPPSSKKRSANPDDSDPESTSAQKKKPSTEALQIRSKNSKRLEREGPVSVKVLKDDTVSRRALPPPAAKSVQNIKNNWLYNRAKGNVKRRAVGGGFVRK